jgi:AcrR family transcriptional regulator
MYPRRVCGYGVRDNPAVACHARWVPRPKSLTEDQIASAALVVLDREGTAGLSMRNVAKELGVGTMSLYRYVEGKEQVEQLVVERAAADVDTCPPPRVRDVLGEHPALVSLLLRHRQTSRFTIAWGDAVMAALDEGGHHGAARVVAFRTLLAYVFGTAQLEQLSSLSGAGTAALAALPEDQHPWVVDTARHAQELSVAEERERGLEVLLRGLGAAPA